MTRADMLIHRLHNLLVARTSLTTPEDAVRCLGAVQSQDYPAAKWAIGARGRGVTDAAIEAAFNEGRLLRTHVMRPTWHFVLPEDITWMLDLTAPRVKAATRSRNRQLMLDDAVFERANTTIARALRGGRSLTRPQIGSVLRDASITSARDDPQRLTFIVLRAELDGVICSGPRVGKQLTYALLAERAARPRRLAREEARAELARRYFSSHGPATVRDFMWWSGLTAADARAGLDAVRHTLGSVELDGKVFWSPKRRPVRAHVSGRAYLLTTWDECFVAYRDRAPNASVARGASPRDWGPRIVIDGQIAGTWRRGMVRGTAVVEARPFGSFRKAERQAIAEAAERYGRFLGVPVTVRFAG